MGTESNSQKKPFLLKLQEDRIIRGDLFPAKSEQGAAAFVVICHGFKGFKDWGMFPYVAEQLSEQYHVVTFNFSYNGIGEDAESFSDLERFAANTYHRELEDLEYVISSIRNGNIPTPDSLNGLEQFNYQDMPIYLLGHSRGGAVSLIYTLDHPDEVSGVISWNGVVNVDFFNEQVKKEMRETGRGYVENARTNQRLPLNVEVIEDIENQKEKYDIITRSKSLQVPVALIQSTDDMEHLRLGSQRLVEAQPSIEWIQIDGGKHTFGAVHPFAGITPPLAEALAYSKACLAKWNG